MVAAFFDAATFFVFSVGWVGVCESLCGICGGMGGTASQCFWGVRVGATHVASLHTWLTMESPLRGDGCAGMMAYSGASRPE